MRCCRHVGWENASLDFNTSFEAPDGTKRSIWRTTRDIHYIYRLWQMKQPGANKIYDQEIEYSSMLSSFDRLNLLRTPLVEDLMLKTEAKAHGFEYFDCSP
nr:hypothetical protein CFP56_28788 [Quercus suber]